MSKKMTAAIWFGTIALFAFVDFFLDYTWSEATRDYAFRHPMIAVMTCVLPTHWFVPVFYGTEVRREIMLSIGITVVIAGMAFDVTGSLSPWFFGNPSPALGLILYCLAGLGLGLMWPQRPPEPGTNGNLS